MDAKLRDDIIDDDEEGEEEQEEEYSPEKATEKLILACKENNIDDVIFALQKNAIPTEEREGWTPLLWAACNGNE
jgi:ankyrin repeat protein